MAEQKRGKDKGNTPIIEEDCTDSQVEKLAEISKSISDYIDKKNSNSFEEINPQPSQAKSESGYDPIMDEDFLSDWYDEEETLNSTDIILDNNVIYHDFLDYTTKHYQKLYLMKRIMRWIFFVLIMLLLLVIVALPVVLIIIFIILHPESDINYNLIAGIVGSVITMVSSLIILPKIIAEHLFPKDDDEGVLELIIEMQKNDDRLDLREKQKEPK